MGILSILSFRRKIPLLLHCTDITIDILICRPLNYEDENINVVLPIFAIHGNHDDPTREVHLFLLNNSQSAQGQALSALDILNSTRLLNYFARIEKYDCLPSFHVVWMTFKFVRSSSRKDLPVWLSMVWAMFQMSVFRACLSNSM